MGGRMWLESNGVKEALPSISLNAESDPGLLQVDIGAPQLQLAGKRLLV